MGPFRPSIHVRRVWSIMFRKIQSHAPKFSLTELNLYECHSTGNAKTLRHIHDVIVTMTFYAICKLVKKNQENTQ